MRRALGRPITVGLVATGIMTLLFIRVLFATGSDPTVFTAFGNEAISTTEYAEERLGEVWLRAGQGHDGKYFFVQAHDPLILHPAENALVLDLPLYRSQRMLYPLVAGGFGAFGSVTIVWSMVIVNLIAMGAGTYATARVAQHMGGSAWWGLAFTLNIGLISAINISGAGIVASALAFGAVAAVLNKKHGLAIALLTLSALSREVFLVAAFGMAWWLWRDGERRTALGSVLTPVTAVGLWAIYLRVRIDRDAGASEVQEIGWPFGGFIQAIPDWMSEPLNLAAGLAIMVLFAAYVRRTLISSALVGWTFIGFVFLPLLFTKQVWADYFDITRAVAPAITAFVLMMFLTGRSGDRGALSVSKSDQLR